LSAADLQFSHLLDVANGDTRVLGLLLGGSRGKEPSYVTERSDYDVYVIVQDEKTQLEYEQSFSSRHGDSLEVMVVTLDSYRSHALAGSGTEWNAYTFAHVTPLIDRLDGEITRLTREKAQVDPDSSAPRLLDAYINSYYRASKNHRDGLLIEAHLDAAESVPWFLGFLFAAFGRVRPYNKWLQWELRAHPLPAPWSVERLVPAFEAIVASGDRQAQVELFRDAEWLARERNWGDVIEGWQADVDWLRGEVAS
jgi:hypothetical protein